MPTYSKSQVTKLLKVPKGEPKKKKNVQRWLTFYDPGMSLIQLRDTFPKLIYPSTWYDKEPFALLTEEPCMRKITMDILPETLNKTWDEQKALMPKGQTIPLVRQLMMAFVIHFLSTGENMLENGYWSRCGDAPLSSGCVPDAFWDRGNGRARMGGGVPRFCDPDGGARAAVRVDDL